MADTQAKDSPPPRACAAVRAQTRLSLRRTLIDIRRTGCASLDLCWVACGRLEGYVELSLQPWDYAAGLLLVEEAGGRVTAPDGSPLSLCQGGPLLATNGRLHTAMQSLLK